MGLLNIEPIQIDSCYCLLSNVIPAAKFFNKDYQLMFAGVWGFDLAPQNQEKIQLADRLENQFSISPQEILRDYHGIEMINYSEKSPADMLSIIRYELDAGKPVMIFIDAYYCMWTQKYKKAHAPHYCLVVGIDEILKDLICIDAYMTDQVVRIPIDDYKKGHGDCFTFINLQDNKISTGEWESVIKISPSALLAKKEGINSFDMMRMFAKEIKESDDFISEMHKQNESYSYDLIINLKELCFGRINYASALEFANKKYLKDELSELVKSMLEVGASWKTIGSKFTKISYLQSSKSMDRIRDTVYNQLMMIAQEEERIAEKILDIF